MIRQWLLLVSEPAVDIIDVMATLIVCFATAVAFVRVVQQVIKPDSHARARQIWLDYGRWLVAGLTFQLAADVIESSIVPSWEGIAQLGAVALIRTFLNYFLERDITEIKARQRAQPPLETG
ncbi:MULTISPECIES: DUF1622 domain-containing protein [Stenotrophomonas]|uniref:DUF1622 domain-containing protein n=1 Tax=Stenotrophomonas TaxID=40323 RepID=UPI0007704CF6|nr:MULTISPECIES: DUF1622 domain-containing protein [Stenotrophomonas]AMJ55310.1 hypothetical protein AXG53_00675 [Stenotrophomonas sp. KCTC 12332]